GKRREAGRKSHGRVGFRRGESGLIGGAVEKEEDARLGATEAGTLRRRGGLSAVQSKKLAEPQPEWRKPAGDEHLAARQAVAKLLRRTEDLQHRRLPNGGAIMPPHRNCRNAPMASRIGCFSQIKKQGTTARPSRGGASVFACPDHVGQANTLVPAARSLHGSIQFFFVTRRTNSSVRSATGSPGSMARN